MQRIIFKILMCCLIIVTSACNNNVGGSQSNDKNRFGNSEVGIAARSATISFNKNEVSVGDDIIATITVRSNNSDDKLTLRFKPGYGETGSIMKFDEQAAVHTFDMQGTSQPQTYSLKLHAIANGHGRFMVVDINDGNDDYGSFSSCPILTVVNNIWTLVGKERFSITEVDNEKLAIAPDGTKYLAFRDFYDSIGRVTVMYNKDDKHDWQLFGNSLFSKGRVDDTSIAIASNNKIYVAYIDEGLDNKAVVMTYNTNNNKWEMLGSSAVSPGVAKSTSIAINPINNEVYLAYSDYSNVRNGFAKVVRFDNKSNSWVDVGSKEYVLANQVKNNNLAFDKNGNIYLALSDYGFAMGRAVVFSYSKDDDKWHYVGSPAISSSVAESINLVVGANNTLYLAYSTAMSGGQVIALYYDQKKSGWYPLGKDVVATGYNLYVSLAITPNNNLYIAYGSPYKGDYANVVSYDDKDQSWKTVGISAHVSVANVDSLALTIDKDNSPVLAFADLSDAGLGRSTVMKYYIA